MKLVKYFILLLLAPYSLFSMNKLNPKDSSFKLLKKILVDLTHNQLKNFKYTQEKISLEEKDYIKKLNIEGYNFKYKKLENGATIINFVSSMATVDGDIIYHHHALFFPFKSLKDIIKNHKDSKVLESLLSPYDTYGLNKDVYFCDVEGFLNRYPNIKFVIEERKREFKKRKKSRDFWKALGCSIL